MYKQKIISFWFKSHFEKLKFDNLRRPTNKNKITVQSGDRCPSQVPYSGPPAFPRFGAALIRTGSFGSSRRVFDDGHDSAPASRLPFGGAYAHAPPSRVICSTALAFYSYKASFK
ncbi:hypothetical protein EVAR_39946_1 [Eumeta japonica]|uniref:Uncharacterized protein n=1 Tax=Eumeta variegata TaxID=151549 RepID=A0A4C1X4T6_EUMVA|nr:hypothetical protein EVAR_39946_1 [Eumeta japonica]